MSRLGYKVAIVTGGAEGFGAAEALAADGATVLLTGSGGEAQAGALSARGLKAEYHRLNAADPLDWAALVDKIMRTHGHLDVLVNHAGANISCTIEDATGAQLREILDENLLGPFLGTKAVIPAMRQSGGGSIINIAANAIVEILPLYALYGAAKAALVNLTKTTAAHCFRRGYGIRVNAVHPGGHETQLLTDNALRLTKVENLRPLLAALQAGGTAPLHEFSAAVTYLAADESAHVTGTELYCAGALTAQSLAAAPG
jgi:NAD(P)-dependent dehydrogenase (short-subunit alcohol dehydrogenase family)